MESVQHIAMAEEQNARIDQTLKNEGGKLLQFIRKRVRDEDDAEDVFQDVFSQLVESYRGLERIERVTAWLFRVAKNKIADLYRRRRPEPLPRRQADAGDDGPPVAMLEDILPDLSNGPEEAMMRDAIWTAIEEALEELPNAQRQVFVWHEIEGMTFRDMAILTGESENTLRLRKYNAVQFLRRRLESYYLEL
jgi:RNA polymerase sigma factor (sigma-70 family)